MEKFKTWLTGLLTFAIAFSVIGGGVSFAANSGDVVINEIAWAGTTDSSGDEWIELYNPTSTPVDLTGWIIEDDEAANYVIDTGVISARGYFLIEDSEDSINVPSDALSGLSLANTGDSLVLKDEAGVVIDSVNASGGAWYAGNATSKASMERVDPVAGDTPENFISASSGNGSVGRAGTLILGTPGSVNSNYDGGGPAVSFNGETDVATGDIISLIVNIDEASDLYAYGFDIGYDSAFLDFLNAEELSFLNSDDEATSFNSALEDNVEGKLLVANSRLGSVDGIDGSGALFSLSFEVIGSEGSSEISFLSSSFLSDSVGGIPAGYDEMILNIYGSENVDDVSGIHVDQGADRFSLDLIWDYGDADSYLVKKLMPNGSYELLLETTDAVFTDADVMPGITYDYLVIPVKNGAEGESAYISGTDTRGILADFNKDDRVDGKDLEMLARSYGSSYGEEGYQIAVDSNYDGVIDGSDLIDLGVNFAVTY